MYLQHMTVNICYTLQNVFATHDCQHDCQHSGTLQNVFATHDCQHSGTLQNVFATHDCQHILCRMYLQHMTVNICYILQNVFATHDCQHML